MSGTLELHGNIPAKLIFGDTELDVEIISLTRKECEHRVGIINRRIAVTEETTITCVQRKFKKCE